MSNKKLVRIIFWNILNNAEAAKGHLEQQNRMPEIVDELSKFCGTSPTIIFLCEVEGSKISKEIAKHLPKSYKFIDQVRYSNDFMAVFSNVDVDDFTPVKLDNLKVKWPKNYTVSTTYKKLNINCVHNPAQPQEELARIKIFKTMLTQINERANSIIVGDTNALWFFPCRVYLLALGYKLAWRPLKFSNREVFPQRHYRGVNVPKLIPNIAIDAIYYGRNVKLLDYQTSLNTASDHPIIVADLALKN